jgi:urease accessory protein UreH
MSGTDGGTSNDKSNTKGEIESNIQKMASAIEDLLYMEAIKFNDANNKQSNKAVLSSSFALIVSNVISSMNLKVDNNDEMMKLMYFSLLIYLNEHLKLPKSLTMAFGNDLEKHRDEMESGELISNYVTVLHNIFSSVKKR